MKSCNESFCIDIILKQNKTVEHVANTFTVSCEKSKAISFASSKIKNVVVFATEFQARFLVKSICCIAFGSASSAFCLLKSLAIDLNFYLK